MHRNAQKDNIARSIVVEVKRRGGRFLRRSGSKPSDPRLDVDVGWIEIDDASATEKVKQTIRDNKSNLHDSTKVRKCNVTWDIPSSPVAAKRSSLRSTIPTLATQRDQHQAARRDEETSAVGQPASQIRLGHRRQQSTEANGANCQWTKADEPDGAATDSRQQYISIPSLPQHSIPWHTHRLSDNSFHQQRMVDMLSLLDIHGLTHIGSQRGPLRSQNLDRYPSPYFQQQQSNVISGNSHYRSLSLPQYYQRDFALGERPENYQRLLPGALVANARQSGQPSHLAPEDAIVLHQARNAAIKRAEMLRRIQNVKVDEERGQVTDLVSSPEKLPRNQTSFAHYRRHHQDSQQRSQFDRAESRKKSESKPLDDRKPTARPTWPKGKQTTDVRLGQRTVTNNSADITCKRERKDTDSPSSSTSSGSLPLKKRAKRD